MSAAAAVLTAAGLVVAGPTRAASADDVCMSFTAISAGGVHSLAVGPGGTVWAWGGNDFGQLGDGTTTDRHAPVQVPGLSGITTVSAGFRYSLALSATGTVWAWGDNGSGQLGDGTTTQRLQPVPVVGPTNIAMIAAGAAHAFAVRTGGIVWAWGDNGSGQLGDGTMNDRHSPVQLAGIGGITAIAGGWTHSLAIGDGGAVYAWGNNTSGQLGDGTFSTTVQSTPAAVPGLSRMTRVAASGHSMASTATGTVWTWGLNRFRQLGDPTTTALARATPTAVPGLGGIATPYTSGDSSVALGTNGALWAWGLNDVGQLGDGQYQDIEDSPVQVAISVPIVAAATGREHLLALDEDGVVWAAGFNGEGQLGDGTTDQRGTPVPLCAPPSAWTPPPPSAGACLVFSAVAASNHFSLAVGAGGTVASWGDNDFGQLGDGTRQDRHAPVQVPGLAGITRVAAGHYHSLAVGAGGLVWGWGWNYSGQVGDGTAVQRLSPVRVSGLSDVSAVDAGGAHSLAIGTGGDVWAWGSNSQGELGDGTTTSRRAPVRVPGLSAATVAAGGAHSLGVDGAGAVWAWGHNSYGQLGDGTTASRSVPGLVPGLSGITAVAAGYDYSLALGGDGTVWAWGNHPGTSSPTSVPVQMAGLPEIVAVAAGDGRFSLALDGTGAVWAWGNNGFGALGDGTTMPHAVPAKVMGLTGINGISAGTQSALSVGSGGAVWAWGLNTAGQLGDGTTTSRYTPVPTCTAVAPVPPTPDLNAGVVSTCVPARLPSGLVVLVTEAHAFSPAPAATTYLTCTVTGVGNESMTVTTSSPGPVVSGTSNQLMTAGALTACSSASAVWLEPSLDPVGARTHTRFEQRHCITV